MYRDTNGDFGQEEHGEDTAVGTYRHQQWQEIASGYAPQNQVRVFTVLPQRILLQVQQKVFRREALRQGCLGSNQLQHRIQVKNIQTDNMQIIIKSFFFLSVL